jgi:hypothetical protein
LGRARGKDVPGREGMERPREARRAALFLFGDQCGLRELVDMARSIAKPLLTWYGASRSRGGTGGWARRVSKRKSDNRR